MSILNKYRHVSHLPITISISLVIVLSVLNKHGSQPAALMLFILLTPFCFGVTSRFFQDSKLWLFTLVYPLIASLPLLVTSGTSEAIAAPSRYVIAAICLIGLSRVHLNSHLIFRAASIGAILTLLINIDQFSETRINWGVGVLESGYLAVVLLSLSLTQIFLDQKKPVLCILGIVGSLCAITLAVKTGSRGTWPAIIIVCYLHFLMIPLQTIRKVIYSILGILVLIFSALYVPSINDRIELTAQEVNAYYDDNDHATSMGYRLDFWHIAIDCFTESPLWGVSYDRRREIIENYIDRNNAAQYINVDGRSSSHNEILNAMSKKGSLGLLAILFLYFVPLHFFIRHLKRNHCDKSRYTSMGAIGVVVAMIVCGITEAPLMNVRVATTYGFIMVFLYLLVVRLTNPDKRRDCSEFST